MNKNPFYFIIFILLILVSCNSSDDDNSDQTLNNNSTIDPIHSKPDEPAPVNIKANPNKEKSAKSDINLPVNKPHDILVNIDKYLVSTPVYSASPAGGIVDGHITVQNNLTDITFQKAIVEVNIFLEDGKRFGQDYYIIYNLEPGDIKRVPIPKTTQGTSVRSHIVKIKSDQLTNGETVPVGTKYVSQ